LVELDKAMESKALALDNNALVQESRNPDTTSANSFRLLSRFAMNVVCLKAKLRIRALQEVQ